MEQDIRRRLARELGDEELAAAVASSIDETLLQRLADVDIATTPLLTYRPPTAPDDRIDSLWILAFGYRILESADGADLAGGIPPMDRLAPGPVNERLARLAADFVSRRPVPIIAQWEVADELGAIGVADVISVTPDRGADGSVVYLSTAGVIDKGRRLAAAAGVDTGRAGLLAHADHAGRCLLTAAAAGLDAVVPDGVDLPAVYDPASGQPWTRRRADFIPVDLMARAYL